MPAWSWIQPALTVLSILVAIFVAARAILRDSRHEAQTVVEKISGLQTTVTILVSEVNQLRTTAHAVTRLEGQVNHLLTRLDHVQTELSNINDRVDRIDRGSKPPSPPSPA